MTTTWFTSDLHLGHGLVAGLRGFSDVRIQSFADDHSWLHESAVKGHDMRLAMNWDALVSPDDTVWILGDLTMDSDLRAALQWLDVRPGKKHWVLGNHDSIHPAHRDAQNRYAKHRNAIAMVFESTQTFARRRTQGHQYLMSHFPYSGAPDHHREDHPDFYAQYRLRDLGVPLLHGHTHRPEILSHSGDNTPQFHVGLDAHDLKPVHISKIEEWLNAA